MKQHVEAVQPDAGDQDRRHRHQRDQRGRSPPAACAGSARSFLQNSRSTRLSVIGLVFQVSPGDVGDLLDGAVVGRVEAVVHAGRQPQRDVAAVAVELDQLGIAQQVLQRVGEALGLDQHGRRRSRPDAPTMRVARADQHGGIGIDRARAGLELADEAVVQAREPRLGRLVEVRGRRTAARPPIDRSRTSGCSILLNQPMNCVTRRRGMRLVSRKFRSSCSATLRDERSRTVMIVSPWQEGR